MSGTGTTSDLSIDEILLLHSLDWEPVDLVVGASVTAVPPWGVPGGFNTAELISPAFTSAVTNAAGRLRDDCRRAGGVGVIGVEVDFEVRPQTIHAVLTGTAVRPSRRRPDGEVWVSDLSTRDFCLLHGAGWAPLGLAFGTAVVQVPYRSAGTWVKQMGANVELTNLTEALYRARDRAVERMQQAALAMRATGVVAVQIRDRPLRFASHAMAFTAWGTAVRLAGDTHTYLRPRVAVSLDDAVEAFDLRGAMGES